MADELVIRQSLSDQSDAPVLTDDSCTKTRPFDAPESKDPKSNSVIESNKSCNSKLLNGVVSHGSMKEESGSCGCDGSSKSHALPSDRPKATLCLPTGTQEPMRKQTEHTDSADSGVHSGTDNGSDTKSSSSSPGLSTESSVQDLSDKTSLMNKCDSSEPLDKEKSLSNDSDIINQLAETVSNTVIKDTDHCDSGSEDYENGIKYLVYKSEAQMPDIMRLITKDLSEPYSIYTYRYFIHNWPKLCFLAMNDEQCVGAIVCKLDLHKKMVRRGYIAMLAVDQSCRRKGIGSHLVLKAIRAMIADDCDEVVLETEITNQAALRLYENLGFVRDKRLFRYYLNGVDALRLKLWLR